MDKRGWARRGQAPPFWDPPWTSTTQLVEASPMGGLLLEVKLCVVLCAVCCMSLCGCCVLCAVCCLLCVGCGALLPVLGLVPLPVLRLVPCCKPLKLCTCRFKVKCVCLLWVELWSLLGAVCGLWCCFLITLRWQGGVLSKVLGLLWVAFWPPVLSPSRP